MAKPRFHHVTIRLNEEEYRMVEHLAKDMARAAGLSIQLKRSTVLRAILADYYVMWQSEKVAFSVREQLKGAYLDAGGMER